MKTTRLALVTLFRELNFNSTSKWNKKRMMARVRALPEQVDQDVGEDLSTEGKELFDRIFDAVEKDEEIEVEPNPKKGYIIPAEEPSQSISDPLEPEVPEEKPAPKKKKSVKKPAKKVKKSPPKKSVKKSTKKPTPKKKTTSTKRDRWGSRIGTKAARINSCFGRKEKLPGDIGRELGLTSFNEQCCVR